MMSKVQRPDGSVVEVSDTDRELLKGFYNQEGWYLFDVDQSYCAENYFFRSGEQIKCLTNAEYQGSKTFYGRGTGEAMTRQEVEKKAKMRGFW